MWRNLFLVIVQSANASHCATGASCLESILSLTFDSCGMMKLKRRVEIYNVPVNMRME